MNFLTRIVYTYVFVSTYLNYKDFDKAAYNFADSIHVFIDLFKLTSINYKDVFENKSLIFTYRIMFNMVFSIIGIIGLRIGPIMILISVIFDAVFNVKNWNFYVLIFNISI
jgi:hypothetical protein